MESLLDFSREFDVGLMDKVVMAFYTGLGQEQAMAQQVLTQFQDHPESWTRVPDILEKSSFPQAKYIGLQILEKLIQTRWKTLPEGQRQGIRNFIVGVTVKVASDEVSFRKEKTYINKLNLALVQILKQEWPHNWPTFITELVESSKTNLSLCENNMVILKLLSEEVFDFSAEQMTQAKIKNLKNQMCGEFPEIFKLCSEVLEEAQKVSLIKATLETLLRFLNWIPLGYIFETTIIDLLLNRFLEAPEFRNVTLKCLAEIAALNVGPEYDPKFVILFAMVMTSVNRMIPPSTNIAHAYQNAGDSVQELVLNLALFLANFLSNHLRAVESEQNRDVLLNAHLYMVKISQVDEREIFKICLEYWLKLVAELYEEIQSLPIGDSGLLMGLSLGGSNGASMLNGISLRKNIYSDVLSNLRLVVIERMVKPEEVLIVENDEGEIVREFMKESDTIVLYKSMRELLVYLTHLDVTDTENILTEKLAKQVDGSEWSWNNLNTLCWAIGSISGAMNEDTEKRFLVMVIKDLLGLCEIKRGKDNKAVVASDIMYIVGQYPRFLKAHWKFLKTVVNKLFEFMHETHEGVQDMACDTFIKIAQKCRRHFVMHQSGETEPFVDEILRLLHRITVDLSPQQVHTFYEAVGYMISAQPTKPQQEKLIAKLMELPNNAWDSLMAQAAQNMDVLSSPDNIKILTNVLKTNVAACTSIGSFYLPQLGRIFLDMLGLYKAVSGIVSETVLKDGPIATKTPKVRQLRTVKKEVLKLMETNVKKAEDLEAVNVNFMPPLLDAILGDYNRNTPAARDAEVLNVMATIISRLGPLLTPQVPAILDAVSEPTLNMINQDFAEFPEHRVGFFKLLRAINLNCFPALLTVPPNQFKLFMDSIIWAIKHTMRDIADTGLNLCLEVVNNFATAADPAVTNVFFQQYFLSILQDIFFVLTDADHKSGFKLQSALLARLFQLVELNVIAQPLRPQIKKFVENMYQLEIGAAQTTQLSKAITSGEQKGIFVLPKGPSGRIKLAPKSKPADPATKENKPTSKSTSKSKTATTKAKPISKSKAAATKKATSTTRTAKKEVEKPRAPTAKKPNAKKTVVKPKSTRASTTTKKTTTPSRRGAAKKAATGTPSTSRAKAAAKKAPAKKAAPAKKEAAKPAAKPRKAVRCYPTSKSTSKSKTATTKAKPISKSKAAATKKATSTTRTAKKEVEKPRAPTAKKPNAKKTVVKPKSTRASTTTKKTTTPSRRGAAKKAATGTPSTSRAKAAAKKAPAKRAAPAKKEAAKPAAKPRKAPDKKS